MTLFAVRWLGTIDGDTRFLGKYVTDVISVRSFIIGVVAGSGYGAAVWWTGTRPACSFLMLVFLLQVAACLTMLYLHIAALQPQFKDGVPMSFWQLTDQSMRELATTSILRGKGPPMGGFGYFVRAMEILGFAAGSLFAASGLHYGSRLRPSGPR